MTKATWWLSAWKTGANIVTDGPNSDTDTQTTPQRL